MRFYHGGIDKPGFCLIAFDVLEDLPGSEHDLVPSPIGKSDVEAEPGIVFRRFFCCIHGFLQIGWQEGPVADHLDADPVPLHALITDNREELLPEQGEQVVDFLFGP